MSLISNQLTFLITSGDGVPPNQTLEFIYSNMLNLEGERSVIASVNSLVVSGKTRFQGLELLKNLITYCSSEILNENLLHWAGYCVVQNVEDSSKEFKLNILTKIIENADGVESFHKKFPAEHLNATLKACLSCQYNEEKIAGLKCLTQCMKRYPAWFGNHKQKVQTYLIDCLDSSSKAVTESAAVSFIYFLQTGGAGNNGINYSNNYSCEFKKVCATIQTLYDDFFEDFPEIKTTLEIDGETIKFSNSITNASGDDVEGIARRIINCLILLKTMIIKSFPVEKRIVIKHVIDIIYRGLSAHVCYSDMQIVNSIKHGIFLKEIQLQLLGIFRVFVKGYRLSVIPFSVVFENCLLNTLRRIHTCNCFTFDVAYKLSTYKTLINWFSSNKMINEVQLQEKIVPFILKDISLTRKTIILNVKDVSSKHKKVVNQTGGDKRHPVMYSGCIYALESLKCLLTSSISIEQNLLKEVLSILLTILGDVHLGKIVVPYNNPTCQAKLYEMLIALFKKDVKPLPSLHLAIDILNVGANSHSEIISETCKKGLDILERISHPVCPTLQVSEGTTTSEPLLLSQTSDYPRTNENKRKKEIQIISDIIIAPSLDAEIENEKEVCNIPKKVKYSEEVTPLTTESNDPVSNSVIQENLDLHIKNQDNSRIIETDFKAKVVKKITENGNESKSSDVVINLDDDFDDMSVSFQDVIQE